MVEKLKSYIMKPEGYQPQPVRRVYLLRYAQSNSRGAKIRPVGIPTITDRCLQALVNLVLEPLVEMNSDKHSYGFRKYRSAKMAIGAVRKNLESLPEHYDKFVLDADIKGFFDSISHEWLLSHVPLERTLNLILKGWLKAGSIYKDQVVEYGLMPSVGTPTQVRGAHFRTPAREPQVCAAQRVPPLPGKASAEVNRTCARKLTPLALSLAEQESAPITPPDRNALVATGRIFELELALLFEKKKIFGF